MLTSPSYRLHLKSGYKLLQLYRVSSIFLPPTTMNMNPVHSYNTRASTEPHSHSKNVHMVVGAERVKLPYKRPCWENFEIWVFQDKTKEIHNQIEFEHPSWVFQFWLNKQRTWRSRHDTPPMGTYNIYKANIKFTLGTKG